MYPFPKFRIARILTSYQFYFVLICFWCWGCIVCVFVLVSLMLRTLADKYYLHSFVIYCYKQQQKIFQATGPSSFSALHSHNKNVQEESITLACYSKECPLNTFDVNSEGNERLRLQTTKQQQCDKNIALKVTTWHANIRILEFLCFRISCND